MLKNKIILKNVIEVNYRLCYFIFSFIFSIFIFYYFYADFILLLIIPAKLKLHTLILIDPREHILFYIYYAVFLVSIVTAPYIYYNIYDFFLPALYNAEKKKLFSNNINFFFLYAIINYITWKMGLPLFWDFFMAPEKNFNIINFNIQISAQSYLYYVLHLFIITNVLQFLLLFFFKFFNKNLTSLLKQKRFIFLLFIIFSTLVSPPDIFWQFIIFACLCICLEVFIFYYFLILYYTKNL